MLAVLYTDQVGSTAMSNALGDEHFDGLRREIESAIDNAVVRSGGTVLKRTGDGALAVFESAADAIDASVLLHTEVDLIKARGDHKPVMRIGLSVGDVSLESGDAFGAPVVEAARLEAAARPGGTLCTTLVKLLVGSRTSATFVEHAPVVAKGFDSPIEVFEIPWTAAGIAGGVLAESLQRHEDLAFAGRREELRLLESNVESARSGRGRAVLVGGEPGIGKSRLVREVARRAANEGAIVLHGRCDDGMGRPYQPFAEALAGYLRLVPNAAVELGPGASDLRHVLPELVLARPDLPDPLPGDPDVLRYRLFDAVAGWLRTAAQYRPVVLVIDDLHWADRGTGQLVRHVIDAIANSEVMLAVTYRDTEPDGDVDLTQLISASRRLGNVDRIALRGLGVDEIRVLLTAAGHAASVDMAEDLRERTGGNAFFAAEILLALDGTASAESALSSIPDAVYDVVTARVDRLSLVTQTMIQVASVFGRVVSLDQLRGALDWSPLDVANAAREAVSAGVLRELDDPPMHLQFPHALVRTAVYDDLGAAHRALLHGAAAAALEASAGDNVDDVAEQLGGHLAKTGSVADALAAIGWYRRAAALAARQTAEAAAAMQYRRALAVLDQPGVPDNPRVRCELLLELGDALRRARLEGFRVALLQAADLARTHRFDDLLVLAAATNTRGFFSSAGATDHARLALIHDALEVETSPTAVRARLLSNLSVELTFETTFADRLHLSDQAVEIASTLDEGDHLFHVLGMRYGTLWTAHTLDERTELAERLVLLADQLGRDELRYVASWCSFQAAMETGDLALADVMLDAQCAIAENTPTQASYLRIRQALRAIVAGDLLAGEEFVTQAFDSAVVAGEPDAFTFYVSQLASIRYHQGRLDELVDTIAMAVESSPGLPVLKAALGLIHLEGERLDEVAVIVADLGSRWQRVGDELNWLITIALLAEQAAAIADRPLCAQLYTALSPHRDQFVDNATNWFGSVARYLGLLEHRLGRFADADRSFAESVAAHERLPAPLLLARSHLGWGTSLLTRPDPETQLGETQLRAALALAAQYGLASVDRHATAMLAGVNGPTR